MQCYTKLYATFEYMQMVQRDVDLMRDVYLNLRERTMKELDGMSDSDKAQFLRSEIGVINQRLAGLESSSSAYLQRYTKIHTLKFNSCITF